MLSEQKRPFSTSDTLRVISMEAFGWEFATRHTWLKSALIQKVQLLTIFEIMPIDFETGHVIPVLARMAFFLQTGL